MEVDFDKEIDALLRKTYRDGPVLVGDFAGSRHLEADEISAFAENAVPEKSRAVFTRHLADCDRCRKILSNVLALNAEAAPAAASPASAITIAERDMPWYRRFFLFPNLAYVMGGLVLIFGGFLAFTIVRNSAVSDAVVSQVADSEPRRGGPNFQNEPELGSAANAANVSANAMSNNAITGMTSTSNSNAAGSADGLRLQRGPLEPELRQEGYSVDGADDSRAVTAAPPPPPATMAAPKDAKLADRDDVAKEKAEAKVAQNVPYDASKTDSMLKQQQYPGAGATQSGPSRNSENQYSRQLENLERRREVAEKRKVMRAEAEESDSARRSVGGRTFERKQGVWYDTAFGGRPTINVRRGTAEFNRLDGGLRSIANSLQGTIVVVWGAKAYRIQ